MAKYVIDIPEIMHAGAKKGIEKNIFGDSGAVAIIMECIANATPLEEVLEDIKAEIHATAEMHDDGDYYLRDEWIDEIIDNHISVKEML